MPRMGKNRVFFPQEALDQWISEGKVDLSGDELTIKPDERRYRILEAARVLVECTGLPDANELVGRVKTRSFLSELGAEILETSMVLGENAYDIMPGFVGAPIGTFSEHMAATPTATGQAPASDEDLLARFLLESL
jgi:hypothetical protein